MPTNFPTSVDNFTNPTANDSLNLPSHSTQHANANDAIEAIEGYLLNGGQGLTLVKKQTIGSAVSSVAVTDAFNSTYDNYKIIITGGVGSSNVDIYFTIGSSTSGYNYNSIYNSYGAGTPLGFSLQSQSYVRYCGMVTTTNMQFDLEIQNPYLARITQFKGGMNETRSGGLSMMNVIGYLDNTTSHTSITFTPSAGTLTGGTIYVYGYTKGQ